MAIWKLGNQGENKPLTLGLTTGTSPGPGCWEGTCLPSTCSPEVLLQHSGPGPWSRAGRAMGCLSPQEGVLGVWSHKSVITEGPLSSLRCPILPRGSLIVPPWFTWKKGAGTLVYVYVFKMGYFGFNEAMKTLKKYRISSKKISYSVDETVLINRMLLKWRKNVK